MSSKCPECHQAIEQDFGVATCPKCASVLFIDMDGQVQLTKNEASFSEEVLQSEGLAPSSSEQILQGNWIQDENPIAQVSEGPPPSISSDQEGEFVAIPPDGLQSEFGQMPSEMSYELVQDDNEESNSSEIIDVGVGSETEPAENQNPIANLNGWIDASIHGNQNVNENDLLNEDFLEPLGQTGQEENSVVEGPGLTDVSNFANSDQAFGPLSYSVIIENIDTKEIRSELLEALSDPKFQWDPKALMKEIKMGKLKLESLNPVKVSVLVERLQDVPVKVSWAQHAYS